MSDTFLETFRQVSVISSSVAQKLLKSHGNLVENEINKFHRCRYNIPVDLVSVYCFLFNINPKLFINGKKDSNHPISASLRDDANTKILHHVSKLCKTKHTTVRLYNPPLRFCNAVANLGIFTKMEIFVSKTHYSDIKRATLNPAKIKSPIDMQVTLIACTEMEQIAYGAPKSTVIILTDDVYHINRNALYDFASEPTNLLFASFNILPAIAVVENRPVMTDFGAKVELSSSKYRPSELATSQGYRPDWDTYMHFLEDGTFYTGSKAGMLGLLSSRQLSKVAKVFEPLNKLHQVLIMGCTQESLCHGSFFKIPSYHYFHQETLTSRADENYLYLTPSINYAKFRNYVNTTKEEDLVFAKLMAYIRNDEQMRNYSSEWQRCILMSALYETYQERLMLSVFHADSKPLGIFACFRAAKNVIYDNAKKMTFSIITGVNTVKYFSSLAESFITSYTDFCEVEKQGQNTVIIGEYEIKKQKDKTEEKEKNKLSPLTNLTENPNPPSFVVNSETEQTLFELGKENKNFKPPTWLKYATSVEEQMRLLLVGLGDEYSIPIQQNYKDLDGKSQAIIDLWLNGVAGSGKTRTYLKYLVDLDLENTVVICPTSDLVVELSEAFTELCPAWSDRNPKLFQTYMRGLATAQGKNVILDEAWLCPSLLITYLSFLRGLEVIESLVIVGDFQQNKFNDEIVPNQNWVAVINLVQRASKRILKLKKCFRCGPEIVDLVRIFCPNVKIKIGREKSTKVCFTQDPLRIEGQIYIAQSNKRGEIASMHGHDVFSAVTAQGKSVQHAIFEPTSELHEDAFYVGLTRAKETLQIIVPKMMSTDMAEKMNLAMDIYPEEKITLPKFFQDPVYETRTISIPPPKPEDKLVCIDSNEREPLRLFSPMSESKENEEKRQILGTYNLDIGQSFREVSLTLARPPTVNELPRFNSTPLITPNLFDLNADEVLDYTERDIISLDRTTSAADHHQKNGKLVQRSVQASFARNPELLTVVGLEPIAVFPELKDFTFNWNECISGKFIDRYISKLNLKTLPNQMVEDINEIIMSFKNQIKGGLSFRNKVNKEKVGQIVKASSKYYQIVVGIVLNALFEQLHAFYSKRGVFTGCGGSDQDARRMVRSFGANLSVITYDTVKNESRIGEHTLAFERRYIQYLTSGLIPEEVLVAHDLEPFLIFKGEKIDCSLIRNSGQPGTLPRNFVANFALAKLQMRDDPFAKYIIKGDNVAIFSTLCRTTLHKRFNGLELEGKIEIDLEDQWTSYFFVRRPDNTRDLIPIYSYVGERIWSVMMHPTKLPTESDMLNYKILYEKYSHDSILYRDQYPELFNDFAELGSEIVFSELKYVECLLEYKLQLLNTKQINYYQKKYAALKKTTSSSQ